MTNFEFYKTFDLAKTEHEKKFSSTYPYIIHGCKGDSYGIFLHFSKWLYEEHKNEDISQKNPKVYECLTMNNLISEYNNIRNNLDIKDSKIILEVGCHSFCADYIVDSGDNVKIVSVDSFPKNKYLFTYIMFDNHDRYLGLTHRTFHGINDNEILKNKSNYIPKWEDTKYQILRIDRILDDSANIYKNIFEYEK